MVEHDVISPEMPGYPEGMRDLENPPVMFLAGSLTEAPGVAVVGTRRCTRYGSDLAFAFGESLARSGWTTVSGLARGIDAAAHRGTLAGGGHAVGVLGCGIDVRYPAENGPLHDEIIVTGGALLSEYPPETPPDRWRFPARNRLIAAMSAAVVVVEAGTKGGALITARLAAEMGRPVFAVPGDVDRESSKGCNLLIRDGAFPVLGSGDLITELELMIGPAPLSARRGTAALPESGVFVDDLPSVWQCSVGEALARLGRLESEGLVRRSGERILPA